MSTPLCTRCTRRSLSPCPNLNLIHYIKCRLLLTDSFPQKAACTFCFDVVVVILILLF
ncbi:cation-transporting ATPase [Kingella kingae]|nr:cation-transporting ATPase [Kingella kingae]QIF41776.1 cation-transporting ATPase [Kingella kingae]